MIYKLGMPRFQSWYHRSGNKINSYVYLKINIGPLEYSYSAISSEGTLRRYDKGHQSYLRLSSADKTIHKGKERMEGARTSFALTKSLSFLCRVVVANVPIQQRPQTPDSKPHLNHSPRPPPDPCVKLSSTNQQSCLHVARVSKKCAPRQMMHNAAMYVCRRTHCANISKCCYAQVLDGF